MTASIRLKRADKARARRRSAALIVAVAVLATALSGAVVESAKALVDSSSLSLTADGDGSVVRFDWDEGVVVDTSALAEGLPEAAGSQIYIPEKAFDVRTVSEGSVIGFWVEGESAKVLDDLNVHMKERGFTCAPVGGQENALVFYKESGSVRYVFVSCFQTGQDVSAVMQVAYAKGG